MNRIAAEILPAPSASAQDLGRDVARFEMDPISKAHIRPESATQVVRSQGSHNPKISSRRLLGIKHGCILSP